MNYLNDFRTVSAREKHQEYCKRNGRVKVTTPFEKEKWLKFHDYKYQFKVPYVLYSDFESTLKPVDNQEDIVYRKDQHAKDREMFLIH